MEQARSEGFLARVRRCTRHAAFAILAVSLLAGGPPAVADPASPITVTNTDSPDPVASGAELTYTITVVNTAGSKITNVVLADQLNGVGGVGVPPQLIISSTRGSCTQSTTLVTCNAGTIEGGGSWFVTIRGAVTAANGTTINNTATVTGTHTAQNFTTTTTTSTLVSGGSGSALPDLTISKNGPSSVVVSSPMTYTLTINNIGTANATGIKVVDTVPAGVTINSVNGTSLFTCGVAGQTVTCTGGAVNQGSNATITINGTSPSATGAITNTASVDPDDTIPESNELNNTSALVNTQVTSSATQNQLSISVVDNPDPVIPGATLTYSILVTNTTSQRADDVVVVLGTQGLQASSIQVSQIVTNGTVGNFGGCTIAAPQASCSDRTLNAGGTIQMTVSGQVVASAGSTLIGTGTVTGNIKNTGTSTTATQLTTVKPGIDLTITNSDSPDPVCARSWPGLAPAPLVCRGGLTYTYVVGNSGIQTATGVTVRAPLPPGTLLEGYTVSAGSGFTCVVDANNAFVCTGGTIGPESSNTVITETLLAPAVTGAITDTVTVDPYNAIFEGDDTNNTAAQTTQVITGIDLTTKVVDDPPGFDPIATSGTQTYTITVNNLGTQDAANIRLRDTLPSGTRFRDVIADPLHNFTCSYANGVVECVGGAIKGTASNNDALIGGNLANPPDTATITIRIFAQSFAGTMHNEVRVDPLGEIAEADETNNIAVQDTVVQSLVTGGGAFNQLTISQSQVSPDKTNTARNAKVTWVITVGNTGTDTAVGVTVRDFLPAGARYIEATGTNKFNCSQVGGHVDCVGGEIGSGASATITLSAFAPDTPGTYVNQAIVDPDNTIPEGDELDNESQETTVVTNGGLGAFYELSITNNQTTWDKTNTARNALVTYTLVVKNTGSDAVNNVTVTDTLPAGARYTEATGTNQFLCSNAAGVVTCVGGQVTGGGGMATITVSGFAPDTPGTYTNQAIVDPDNAIPEGDEENNRAQETTTVTNGGTGAYNDLSITVSGPTNTYPNGPIQYLLNVTNSGTNDALNVAVRDPLPSGEVFVSATESGATGAPFTCAYANGVVDCTGATITAGGSRSITINANAPNAVVTPPAPLLHNVATVDPDNTVPEGNEFNNTGTAPDLAVTSRLNLTVTQDGPNSASQSDVTDYTVTVTNNAVSGGGEVAHNVVMVDTFPPGLIPLAVDAGSGNNWGCQIFENPVNFVRCVGDLGISGSDASVTIKVTVFITAENGRALDNTACVDPDNTIVESDEFDNCSDHATFVAPPLPKAPDLLVSKSVDSAATTPGSPLVYTIGISNTGDAKAKGWDGVSGLTITDNLPSQVTFVNTESSNGWTCSGTTTVVCHDNGTGLDPGANAQVKIHVTVNTTASLPIANTAAADAAIVDDPSACSSAGGCTNETNTTNNTSTVSSSVGSSGFDLAITSITDTPDPVAAGQPLKYTTVAVNGGTAPASGVHIKLDVPTTGVNFVSADGSNGFNCGAPSGGVIDCVGDLPGGGTTVITANFVMLLSGLPPDLSFTATIDPSNAFVETDEGNNTKTATTTVTATGACTSCVDLVASELTASPEPVAPGGSVTLKFQIANTGDTPATVTPTQPLLWFDTVSDGVLPNVAPTSSNPAITCQVDFSSATQLLTSCTGTLGPAQAATISLTFTASGTFLQTTGHLDPASLILEANEGNNVITQSVVVH